MSLKPIQTVREPQYPTRKKLKQASCSAKGLAVTAIASASLLLGACGGSQSTDDPIPPPGAPPITHMDQGGDHGSDQPVHPPGAPPAAGHHNGAHSSDESVRHPGQPPAANGNSQPSTETIAPPGEPPIADMEE